MRTNTNIAHIIEHLLWAGLFRGINSFDPRLILQGKYDYGPHFVNE